MDAPPDAPTPIAPLRTRVIIAGVIVAAILFLCVVFGLILAIGIPSVLRVQQASNEIGAVVRLRALAVANEMVREQDADRNGVADYWVADASGLYRLEQAPDGSNQPQGLVAIELARADAAPLAAGAAVAGGNRTAGGRSAGLVPLPGGVACGGYFMQVMTHDQSGDAYARDDDGDGQAWTNEHHFGWLAFPERYGQGGQSIFVLNEGGIAYGKDFGDANPQPATAWPGINPALQGWKVVR